MLNSCKPFNVQRASRFTIGPRENAKANFLTAKDTHESVKKAINSTQLKIGINKVIYSGNSKVIYEGDSQAIYMYPQRDNNKYRSCVIEVTPEQRKVLLSKARVFLQWRSCRVDDHISVLQYFKCLKFGHTANKCKGEVCCAFCAGSHASSSCENKNDLRCRSCISSNICVDINQSADDKSKCPIMRK